MTPFQILYEDKHILVCEKPHGLPTQSKRIGSPDMVNLLKKHIWQTSGAKEPYVAVIHRLDQPVRGILVFAKTPAAAKDLNRQLQNKSFGKYYRALVTGSPKQTDGTLEDYMVKDGRTNTSRICTKDTKDAKTARLHYRTVTAPDDCFFSKRADAYQSKVTDFDSAPDSYNTLTELEIKLDTGRHHQIRCQLAHMGCPIVGDTKYNASANTGKDWQQICLCAFRLEFKHPVTGKPMKFELPAEHKNQEHKNQKHENE